MESKTIKNTHNDGNDGKTPLLLAIKMPPVSRRPPRDRASTPVRPRTPRRTPRSDISGLTTPPSTRQRRSDQAIINNLTLQEIGSPNAPTPVQRITAFEEEDRIELQWYRENAGASDSEDDEDANGFVETQRDSFLDRIEAEEDNAGALFEEADFLQRRCVPSALSPSTGTPRKKKEVCPASFIITTRISLA